MRKRPASDDFRDPSHTSAYLIAIVTCVVVGVGSVVLFMMFASPDRVGRVEVIAAMFTALIIPTTLSLLGLLKASEAAENSIETRHAVNSRLDEMVVAARHAGIMLGREEGREIQRINPDAPPNTPPPGGSA